MNYLDINHTKAVLLCICIVLSLNTHAQDLKFKNPELQKLESQLEAGSLLLGYSLNNGSSIEAGYNFIFGVNSVNDISWDKLSLKAGYSPSIANDLYSLSAGFAHTRNLIAYRADLTTSFSDGDTNISIHPKIGLDLLIVELYIGYNRFFKTNIPDLENQITFSVNINFGWTFFSKESLSQALKSL